MRSLSRLVGAIVLLCPAALSQSVPSSAHLPLSSSLPSKIPDIRNVVHYPIYIPVSNMNSANNIRGPASFVGQPMYPGMRDNGQWLGVASEGLSDWSMPMVEFYDEQQLTKQKDQIRQRMEKLRKNRERYRGDSEAKREERPRNDASRVEPFDHEPQTSSSDMADRFASHNGRQPMRSRQPTRNRLTNVHNLW